MNDPVALISTETPLFKIGNYTIYINDNPHLQYFSVMINGTEIVSQDLIGIINLLRSMENK